MGICPLCNIGESPSRIVEGYAKPACSGENMPKQMRKGTQSCLPCRRRKVRCSYGPEQSKKCVNCAKRNAPCVPQGGIQSASRNSTVDTEREEVPNPRYLSFFNALGHLRRWVQSPVSSSAVPHPSSISQTPTELPRFTNGPDVVQSEHAPVMKLFNDLRLGHAIKTARNSDYYPSLGSQQHANQIGLAKAALSEMLSTLPSDAEIQTIFQTRSRWWETWRQSFGLGWGEDENKTLESFATHAVCTGNPSLLGSLLVCFALSCGDYHRYLTPVEHWILAEDNFSGNAYDFQCIIALGLCLLSALQPSRAWSVFRTATTRLQLAGIHKNHQKSESLDVAFWQIFGADRWVSLLIGLPYSAPDHLYDLEIPEATESSYIKFHYRHLTILAGRVIDVLQSDPPPSLSKLISVEERIDEITAQLPPDYLDIGQILTSPDVPNKSARLYRLTHIHQLKSFLYLPLFLQISGTRNGRAEQRHGVKYGISTCTNSARSFLGAFFTLFDLDPSTAAADNSIKLTALTALCAAVVLYLNSLSSGEKDPSQTDQSRPFSDPDIALVYRVIFILQVCSEGREESLCGQCHQALHKLISCGDEIDLGGSRQISVPCFGIITLMRGKGVEASNISETGNWDPELADTHSHSQAASGGEHIQLENVDPISPLLFDDMFFSYQGPWNPNELEFDWLNQGIDLTSYPCGFSNLDST